MSKRNRRKNFCENKRAEKHGYTQELLLLLIFHLINISDGDSRTCRIYAPLLLNTSPWATVLSSGYMFECMWVSAKCFIVIHIAHWSHNKNNKTIIVGWFPRHRSQEISCEILLFTIKNIYSHWYFLFWKCELLNLQSYTEKKERNQGMELVVQGLTALLWLQEVLSFFGIFNFFQGWKHCFQAHEFLSVSVTQLLALSQVFKI